MLKKSISLPLIFIIILVMRVLQTTLSTLVKQLDYISCYFNNKLYKVTDILLLSSFRFAGYMLSVLHNVHNYFITCFDEHICNCPLLRNGFRME